MEAAFNSLAFALFLAAHLFAVIALTARKRGSQGGGTQRTSLRTLAGTRPACAFGRVNMRLIDDQSGLHVWAESFERPSSARLSVRDSSSRSTWSGFNHPSACRRMSAKDAGVPLNVP